MMLFGSYKLGGISVALKKTILSSLLIVAGTVPAFPAEIPVVWRGDWTNQSFFPIAVWLQSPANAAKYREAGINTYVGLWRGPTQDQLAALRKAGMRLICDQNETALSEPDSGFILAWMHGDEPDNAQSLGEGKGWGPPIAPEVIVEDYRKLRERDPSRPVLLNLGQGVAWDNWHGRGVRSRHPEDYPKYIQGCDVVSFDIYPAVHDHPEVAGKLDFVARGVERLVKWSDGKKRVWNCLECTRIGNEKTKPTPDQVRAEAWMSIIHGSRGFIYFVHQFKPEFREAALVDDPEMLAAVTKLNRQIQELAPVINSIEPGPTLGVKTAGEDRAVAALARSHAGETYVFAVEMTGKARKARFTLEGGPDDARVEVLGEGRSVDLGKEGFEDDFGPWEVHLYRLKR